MKNTNKFLLLTLLCLMSHLVAYGQSATIMFLDIPGLNGDYQQPGARPVVTAPGPKQNNILIDSYSLTKANSFRAVNANTDAVGKADAIGLMTLSFHIDKSIIALSERLFSHTVTPSMNLFIDFIVSPGEPQRERMRIKMTNVSIQLITQDEDIDGIPVYHMTIRFEKNLTAVTTYNISNVPTTTPYCWDYITASFDNCPTEF